MLSPLPETPEWDQRELQLLVALGVPLYMTKGPAAPEAETIYERARELSTRLTTAPQLAPAYLGLTRYYAIRGKLQTARELADKLLALARQFPDASFLAAAYAAQGAIRFFLGDFPSTRSAAEHVIENYDAEKHGSLIFRLGEEPGILGLATQAWALWYLGYPDQAMQKCQEANSLTQVLPHPFNIAFAHVYAGFLHHLRGEVQEAQHRTDALLTLATEQEIPFWVAPGLLMRGWALTEQGALNEGIALMRQGLGQLQAFGAEVWWVVYQVMLSEVYQKAGHLDEGRECLDEAVARAQEVGEFFHSAELYRLKGTLTLQSQTSLKQV